MSLSRIYRDVGGSALRKVNFLDFDQPAETVGEEEKDSFVSVVSADEPPSQEEPQAEEPADVEVTPPPPPPPPIAPAIDVEKIKQESFSQGKQAGLDQAEAKFGQTIQALADAFEDISRLRESILQNSAQDMLRLVMTIAEQVVQSEVTEKKDIILTTLRHALHAAVKSDEFHIKVNPEDFDIVNEKKPLFMASISGLKNITLESDPKVAAGGCMVESALGQVDATIETQLDEIRRHLAGKIGKG